MSGLLFADDIILISRTAGGLRRLFRLVKDHCDKLLLEINTGEGKSEVISPSDDVWELIDGDGAVELSFSCGVHLSGARDNNFYFQDLFGKAVSVPKGG